VERFRTDVPGDTHGTIACGETRCQAGEEACREAVCVPLSPERDYAGDTVFECDDSSDCAAGSTCCELHMEGGYCQPREGNAPPRYCNEELCIPNAGAPCPTGEACVTPCTDGLCPSYCETSPLRATCAPGKRCEEQVGLCLWTYATATGQCVDPANRVALIERADEDESIGVFACTKPSDCAPMMRCCTSRSLATRGTFCQPASELANGTFLCTSDADCRKGMQEPFTRARCVLASRDPDFKEWHYPPWISLCRFTTPDG